MSVINSNLNALVSQESKRSSDLKLSQAMERLSTGKRINAAKDDAAGLAITNRMTSQVRGIQMAVKNSNDAISMIQTAEGAYGQVGDILQRMRELAVQSATGTMSASDRSSLQLEVSQLVDEIDHIAKTTNFNTIKLLDGTAKDVIIQTGADQVDKIKMSFDSVRANHIGSDIQPSLTSYGGTTSTETGALAEGDLVINGVNVGDTFTEDDALSTAEKDASAIAKVAAINRVCGESGVVARVAGTTVSGTDMDGTAASGTITINGYTTESISVLGVANQALSRKLVADAINAISGATGVKAIDTQSDKNGITLVAADGRNIDINLTGLTAGNTGIAGTATYIGSFHLYSIDGSDFTVDSKENAVTGTTSDGVQKAGLRVGRYGGGAAQTMTMARTAAAAGAAASDTTTGVLNGDTLVINGIAIGASIATDDTASNTDATSSSRAQSAIAIAAAINKQSDRTGVVAKAEANVLRGTGFTAGSSAVAIYINGVTINTNNSDIDNIIDAINEVAGQTGVVARRYGDAMELVAADGRNISIGATAGAANIGLSGVTIGTSAAAAAAVTFYSTVALTSDEAFTVDSGYEGNANFELLGFRRGTFGGAKGDKISEVDISTQSGANDAIRAIDHAINQVSAAQANSGALNNRLDYIINNLSEGYQNMSASRSRILDTDYATVTTELAKQQIIQQAATAMLAQANQAPQTVLALLR